VIDMVEGDTPVAKGGVEFYRVGEKGLLITEERYRCSQTVEVAPGRDFRFHTVKAEGERLLMGHGHGLSTIDDIFLAPEAVHAADEVAEERDKKADMDNLGIETSPGPTVPYNVPEPLSRAERGVESEAGDEENEEVYPEGFIEAGRAGCGKPLKEDGVIESLEEGAVFDGYDGAPRRVEADKDGKNDGEFRGGPEAPDTLHRDDLSSRHIDTDPSAPLVAST